MPALREHLVYRDEDIVTQVKNTLKEIHAGVVTGELPARTCLEEGCPRAKSCTVRERCFALASKPLPVEKDDE